MKPFTVFDAQFEIMVADSASPVEAELLARLACHLIRKQVPEIEGSTGLVVKMNVVDQDSEVLIEVVDGPPALWN